jgi:protease I
MDMLSGHRIAVLAATGVDQEQLSTILKALRAAGGEVAIIADRRGTLMAWDDAGWGSLFKVARTVMNAGQEDFEALCIPGGVLSSDALRANKHAAAFVHAFFAARKPVAAIGHGPQLFVDAGVVRGRRLTSVPTIRQDLINAGAAWEDAAVVVDDGLVTSRGTDDLPAFINKLIEEVWEGRHEGQHV